MTGANRTEPEPSSNTLRAPSRRRAPSRDPEERWERFHGEAMHCRTPAPPAREDKPDLPRTSGVFKWDGQTWRAE